MHTTEHLSHDEQRVRALEQEIERYKEIERTLRDAIEHETCARAKAEDNDAFKEVFLAILGHDLRSPLSNILTTARVMTMKNEVPPPAQPRIDRIVASGEKMQEMISQLLDVTSTRQEAGIPIDRLPDVDLTARHPRRPGPPDHGRRRLRSRPGFRARAQLRRFDRRPEHTVRSAAPRRAAEEQVGRAGPRPLHREEDPRGPRR